MQPSGVLKLCFLCQTGKNNSYRQTGRQAHTQIPGNSLVLNQMYVL